MSKHILIIGAGPGGLASAMRLASQGYTVDVYEAEDRVGGRMRGFTDGPYAFDTGPTILQVPRVYEELFAESGLRLGDYISFKQVLPNTRLHFWDNSTLDLTADLAAFKRQLAAMRPDLPEAFERWYVEHIRKSAVGYGPYLGSPVRSPLGYLRFDEMMAALPFRPWESLYDHFYRYFKDERLAYGMGYQAKYLGMHPTQCSSVFSLVSFLEFQDGIWHPEGGFRALAQAFGRAAEDAGARIHLNRPVQQVLVEDGQARGVLLADGERVRADGVLINADFGYAMQHLLPPEARGSYSDRKLDHMKFSCSTFMLYLGVDRRYDDLPHHQLYLSDSLRRRDPAYTNDTVLDETDPAFYVCNPTPLDPGNAPEGHSTLFVLVPIPNTSHHVNWGAKQRAFRDLIVSRMPMLGYENVAEHIVTETCYTAETWRDEYRTHLGAVFNLTHGWTQLGPLRPHIRMPNVAGLYLIGGAVHPGSGLLTILEASRSAQHFIGQDLPVEHPGALAAL